jgi:3-isopropylmalate dehydrogenase
LTEDITRGRNGFSGASRTSTTQFAIQNDSIFQGADMLAFHAAEGSAFPSRPIATPNRPTEDLNARGDRGEMQRAILIGVLAGEGIGPEVISGSLEVLDSVADATNLHVEVREGGVIGRDSEQSCGAALSAQVVQFCAEVFTRGGAILSGPGGGRYVYDMRKQFDLYLKISPIRIENGLPDASRLRPEAVSGTDILITRENTGGIYQGTWDEQADATGRRVASHRVEYSEGQVRRFLRASARLARDRKGGLTVVWKESGLPSISRLWRDCAQDAAESFGIRFCMVDIDLMAYRLIQDAATFDVIAAPNLCGDVLADLGAVLLGSRGVSYSGNYTARGNAVFQTNHGAAYDLAGTDRANPVGQIFSVAMMLRDSFGLCFEADAIEEAVRSIWRDGWRTSDVAGPDTRVVGTREMCRRIAERAGEIARDRSQPSINWSRVA